MLLCKLHTEPSLLIAVYDNQPAEHNTGWESYSPHTLLTTTVQAQLVVFTLPASALVVAAPRSLLVATVKVMVKGLPCVVVAVLSQIHILYDRRITVCDHNTLGDGQQIGLP